ncbi:heme-dependent oxidative N-demethylase family protein [Pseudodonghicola xiamenensis]|uniref:DUF3445 domain-containing protein n=1 Tax=Pseudodonghicola xiamenensis TaxID=337702 RepID=A0A8J3MD31_9RHOB|nr:DUF3445 domain-containing protein [Pseudodonghicola xiamenensis]GHG93041.1 hypothetical protein GCM10010961_25260 [Pseudodonghicola xiamenensis]
MSEILQKNIPYDVSALRRLPGIQPLPVADWLIRDEAFAGQMARRDDLLASRRAAVIVMDDCARPAALELLDMVLAAAYPEAGADVPEVLRPDGVRVPVDRDDPMATLGRLVQEDFLILQKPEAAAEHILTAGVLCFPASWTLTEKFMKPLTRIHVPVPSYDDNIAARVQRLFDGIQVDRPLWRFNALWYDDPELFHPRRESDQRPHRTAPGTGYFRSERQTMRRLPETRAVVFGVHTFVVARVDMGVAAADQGGGSDRQPGEHGAQQAGAAERDTAGG